MLTYSEEVPVIYANFQTHPLRNSEFQPKLMLESETSLPDSNQDYSFSASFNAPLAKNLFGLGINRPYIDGCCHG